MCTYLFSYVPLNQHKYERLDVIRNLAAYVGTHISKTKYIALPSTGQSPN